LPSIALAGRAITGKILDARAHAESSVTGTAKARSIALALEKLDELHESLSGPADGSHSGIIGDSWESAYVDAWEFARGEAHPDDLDPDQLQPTKADIKAARDTLLSGYSARGMLVGPIAQAKRTLAAIVGGVATRDLDKGNRAIALKGWQTASLRSISSAAGLAIFTGAFRQDVRAARLVLRPQLLHPDPTM
jgi:hypothetical protein